MPAVSLDDRLAGLRGELANIAPFRVEGRVVAAAGLSVDIAGIAPHVRLGDRISLGMRDRRFVDAEVIAFRDGLTRAMAFGPLEGVGAGSIARVVPANRGRSANLLPVSDGWLGRIVDPLGRPLDGKGPLPVGAGRDPRASPPEPTKRGRLGAPLELGVRALDLFTTMRSGQRLGMFAGSGVGKSTLLGMLARQAACDVAVVALVGERGREVREFVEDTLGKEGLARSVVIVATSDAPPLLRREAAYAATAVAEHFRDNGANVLLMMDSVTRFCLALREIALAAGEPPATRGYPPSVFAELPRLLERAGPGLEVPGRPTGTITGLYTVLVEGDDHNEPVADAVRGILDGHVILDRQIADSGRFPAIDVLRSVSRASRGCLPDADEKRVMDARRLLATWREMADLVRLGAYRRGTDPQADLAVTLGPRLEDMLRQGREERSTIPDSLTALGKTLEAPHAS
jgi:flagellum-specific ATP synthase